MLWESTSYGRRSFSRGRQRVPSWHVLSVLLLQLLLSHAVVRFSRARALASIGVRPAAGPQAQSGRSQKAPVRDLRLHVLVSFPVDILLVGQLVREFGAFGDRGLQPRSEQDGASHRGRGHLVRARRLTWLSDAETGRVEKEVWSTDVSRASELLFRSVPFGRNGSSVRSEEVRRNTVFRVLPYTFFP